ncbi:xanthine dehydrogenase YagT iron-sulfur-binding subunit [Verrucomicrobium sp. GAS474]|uniref:(2Fe-2S)-binding protein n=1 Tax=Verrucomicrobium sp. GAS474 TaxID=1882831 RepID=UPI00087B66A5|nr:(2Fe-2S)-binding protein [Verrucomicrobium sp. GAS474]SDU12007.1 xanthine dehydrogenase YagT iron-sulfur-binding subunit [Verrucomicrobium sp. GAS474]
MSDNLDPSLSSGWSRRIFLRRASGFMGATMVVPSLEAFAAPPSSPPSPGEEGTVAVRLRINGKEETLRLEPRVTLLDALRDRLGFTGTKKGCDHGTCGACSVMVGERRVLSCLTLAVAAEGTEITTIEGLAHGENLHPVQQAFLECDGFQCGFCTPGQIVSATACIAEGHARSAEEIREWMSGNLCRCSAYPNIVDAVLKAASGKAAA